MRKVYVKQLPRHGGGADGGLFALIVGAVELLVVVLHHFVEVNIGKAFRVERFCDEFQTVAEADKDLLLECVG